jgi:ATP-dependent DNA helicase PIF1
MTPQKRKYDALLFESNIEHQTKKPKCETIGDEDLVLKLINQGKNVFITGSAGTGKSTLLKKIIEQLPIEGTFVTASTGIAAVHINGITLHSFAGIGISSSKAESIGKVNKSKAAIERWQRAKRIIIDEISMVDGDCFDTIEAIARITRGIDKPFGGIQVICCGDFLQLPPVSRNGNYKFCFESNAWGTTIQHSINLRTIHRQKDKLFTSMLEEIRQGVASRKTLQILTGRLNSNTLDQSEDESSIKPTKLFALNRDVDAINKEELENLPVEEEVPFHALDRGNATFIRQLEQHAAPDYFVLKIGAQVMLSINLDIKANLSNGARGVVTGFEYCETLKQQLPVVKFLTGVERTIKPYTWKVMVEAKMLASRTQVPLKYAWALSIHKSQGQTVDKVEIKLCNIFEYGQAYVALSRVTSLDGLILTNFDPKVFKAHPKVLNYYKQF